MQTKLDLDIQNRNPSKLQGFAFYADNPPNNDVYKLHGVTRSGKTTALAACSIDNDEVFLLAAPVTSITRGVVGEDILTYTDRKHMGAIVNIPSNKECCINAQLCIDYPALKWLRFMPLGGKCDGCDYADECPVMDILKPGPIAGITLTYHKIVSLCLASEKIDREGKKPSVAKRIMEKIQKITTNVILDEAHVLGFGKASKMDVYNITDDIPMIDLTPYKSLDEKRFKCLRDIVAGYDVIMSSPEVADAIAALKADVENKAWNKKKVSIAIMNPVFDPEVRGATYVVAAVDELIHLIRDISDFGVGASGLGLDHAYALQNMLDAVMNSTVHCSLSSSNTSILNNKAMVSMVAVDGIYHTMMKSFLTKMRSPKRRIILTSATFCSYDYSKLFYNRVNIKNVLFGAPHMMGDPNNNSCKMMVIPDTFNFTSIGRYSIYHMLEYVISLYYSVISTFGTSNVAVVTRSIRVAEMIKKKGHIPCEYYRSPNMLGVQNDARIMIMIGAATAPTNTFDVFTSTREDSMLMWEENMHIDTFQAASRVKDPAGKEPSIVFAVGITKDICEDIFTWGAGRRIVQDPANPGKTHVVVDRPLASPIISDATLGDGIPPIALIHMNKRNVDAYQDLYINNSTKSISNNDIINNVNNFQAESTYSEDQTCECDIRRESTYFNGVEEFEQDALDNDIEDEQYEKHLEKVTDGMYERWTAETPHGQGVARLIAKLRDTHPEEWSMGKAVSPTVVELPDEEQYLADQLSMIRRSTVGMCYNDPVELLSDCFFIRRDVVAVQVKAGYNPIRRNMRDTTSECVPLNEDMLQGHLRGTHTLGAYNLAPPGEDSKITRSQWMCFDIDAHQQDDDSVYDLMAKQKTATKKVTLLRNLLDKYNIPYLPERSGTDFSYHIWVFHKPINPKIPNWLGKQIWKVLGYPKTEAFPKQVELKSKKDFGNLVKIPLGTHQKNGRKSYIEVDGKWVRWEDGVLVDEDGNVMEKQEVWIYPVDLSKVVIPPMVKNHEAKKWESSYSHDYSGYNRHAGNGAFYEWAIQQDLRGSQGDWVRKMIAAYYIHIGIRDVDALVNLYRAQEDFSEEVTRGKLSHSLAMAYIPPKWETIVEKAPDIAAAFKDGGSYIYKPTD